MKRRAIATLTLILGAGPIGSGPIGTGLIGTALAGETEGAHWGYSGAHGPEHWGEIAPHFIACKSGQAQTPIDIVSRIDADLPRIGFHYRPGGHVGRLLSDQASRRPRRTVL